MELMELNTFKWPGYNQDDDLPDQFVEDEHMKAEEYDEFLRDPGDFTVRKLWPRMSKIFEPLAMIPPLYSMSSGYMWGLPGSLAALPPFQGMLKRLLEVGEEMGRYLEFQTRTIRELAEMGYPTLNTATVHAPFDWLSDYFRGLKGTMFDMFRNPDKMKATVDMLLPMQIQSGIMQAKMSGNPRVFIPLHRGSDAFMSDDMFEEFYWPSLKALMLALIDAGLTPFPWFEGKFTNRLKFLAELPPGKVMGHFDNVDKKKFKEICGDVLCFYGDVPPSLLITGKPGEVADYVKELIDMFGDTGGLIIDGAVEGIPVQAKPENVDAMMKTVFEYGIY
jgi:uroporphyrinogen-III decarboxylase